MRKLKTLFALLVLSFFTIGNVWGTDATLTFNNIGTNLVATADADNVKTATATADEGGSYTINYLNCKSYSNSIFLTGAASGGNAFFSNKTPMPGNIKSIKVYTRTGSSGDAAYHCAFKTTECTSRYVTGSTAVKIGADANHTYTCSVSNAKYFCIALNNKNNGQVIKIEVTYEAVPLITFSPKTLDFGTVEQGDAVTGKTFTVSALALTEGGIQVAGSEHFTIPAEYELIESDNKGAIANTNITVTPVTTYAGEFSEEIVMGGTGDFDEDSILTVTMTVLAKSAVTITNSAHGTVIVQDANENNIASGTPIAETKVLNVSVSGGGYVFTPKAYKTGDESTVVAISAGQLTMPAYPITITAEEEALSCTSLVAPTLNGEVAVTYNSATLTWNSVDHASSYAVSVVNHSTSASIFNGSVNALSKALANLAADTRYDYTVMAVGDGTTYCDNYNPLLEGNFTTNAYPYVTVTYSENGSTTNDNTSAEPVGGRQIMTPFALPSTATATSKAFVGWTTSNYSHATDAPDPLYAPGANYTITDDEDVTLYAVYATITPEVATYTLTPAASVSAGTYIIAAYSSNYKACTGEADGGDLVNETSGFSINKDNQIVTLPDDAGEFTFTAVTGGFSVQNAGGDYLGYTSTSSRKLAFGSSYSDLVWNATALSKDGYPGNGLYLSTSAYKVSANGSSSSIVRGYGSNTYNPIYMFKKAVVTPAEVSNYATYGVPTALDNVENSVKAVKVLRNGVLYIEKAGKTYNAQGQLVK